MRLYGQKLDFRREYYLRDDFIFGQATTFNIGELGWSFIASTSGVATKIAPVADHPGIFRLDSGATASSAPGFGSGSNTVYGNPLPAELFDITFLLRLNQNDTDTNVAFGMGNSIGVAPAEALMFEKKAADTSWFGNARTGGADGRTSAVAAVDTGWHRFRIRRVNLTTIGWSIDEGTEQTKATGIPTTAMEFFLSISNNAVAASKTIDIDYFEMYVMGLAR